MLFPSYPRLLSMILPNSFPEVTILTQIYGVLGQPETSAEIHRRFYP